MNTTAAYFGALAAYLVDKHGEDGGGFGREYKSEHALYSSQNFVVRRSADDKILALWASIANNGRGAPEMVYRREAGQPGVLSQGHAVIASAVEWAVELAAKAKIPGDPNRDKEMAVAFLLGTDSGERLVIVQAQSLREATKTIGGKFPEWEREIKALAFAETSRADQMRAFYTDAFEVVSLVSAELTKKREHAAAVEAAKASDDLVFWIEYRDLHGLPNKPAPTVAVRAIDVADAWDTVDRLNPLARLMPVTIKVQTLAEYIDKPLIYDRKATESFGIKTRDRRDALTQIIAETPGAGEPIDPELTAAMLPPLDVIERANGTTYTLSEAQMQAAIVSVLDGFIDNPHDGEGEEIRTAFDLSCNIAKPLLDALKSAGRR